MIIVLTSLGLLMMKLVLSLVPLLRRFLLRIPKDLLKLLKVDKTFYFCAGDVEIYLASVSNRLFCVCRGFCPYVDDEPVFKDYSRKEFYFQFSKTWKLYHFWRDMIKYYFERYLNG